MKKITTLLPLVFIILLFGYGTQVSAMGDWLQIPTNPTDGTLQKIPENTKCREIEFGNDEKRTDINGVTMYDVCIGSFPKFPSTGIEEGIAPFYYMKYYFFPEPMPLYDVKNFDTVVGNTTIEGLKQEVAMLSEDIEAYNYDEYSWNDTVKDIFLHYPYDKDHATEDPANTTIVGPYQLGYNSFYHNTYRARYFAEEVTFEFVVLEPYKGNVVTNPSETSDVYSDKEILFTGEIIYDLYDETEPYKCFREEYLDYTEDCRSIEFYFPTAKAHPNPPMPYDYDEVYAEAEIINENNANSDGKNTIWKDRFPYKNPGEHRLVVNVKENTQLRYQKDLGGEYQTISEPESEKSKQGAGDFDKAVDDPIHAGGQYGEIYFPRQDIDTGYVIHETNEVIADKNSLNVPSGWTAHKVEKIYEPVWTVEERYTGADTHPTTVDWTECPYETCSTWQGPIQTSLGDYKWTRDIEKMTYTKDKYFLSRRTNDITIRDERTSEPQFPEVGMRATDVGMPILKLEDGHWVYDSTANESYTNYCDTDTDTFGDRNMEYREYNRGATTDENKQNNTICYHNKNKEHHYWKYYWSNTYWYADEPEVY